MFIVLLLSIKGYATYSISCNTLTYICWQTVKKITLQYHTYFCLTIDLHVLNFGWFLYKYKQPSWWKYKHISTDIMANPDWILKDQQRSQVEDITSITDAVKERTIKRIPYRKHRRHTVDNHVYCNEIFTICIVWMESFPPSVDTAPFLKVEKSLKWKLENFMVRWINNIKGSCYKDFLNNSKQVG